MEKITGFLSSLNPDIPYHLSAYYPMYQFSAPPTPPQTLERLKRIAQKKLNYVYLGNVRGQSDTSCKNCGSVLIKRNGYFVRAVNYESGTCKRCGSKTSIIG
jgi:pyruvate formate lyase activating enzyme